LSLSLSLSLSPSLVCGYQRTKIHSANILQPTQTQRRVLIKLVLLISFLQEEKCPYNLKNSFSDAQVLLIPILSRTLPNLASTPAHQPYRYYPISFSTHPLS
ncbi:unnamed protein product, partial [Prunus brigantina]